MSPRYRETRIGSGYRRRSFARGLRVEPLEYRRLLALVTVNTLSDTVDLNDGVTSLREAIFATNLVGGDDTIEFAASLTSGGPATIMLTQGELAISDSLTINGPGAGLLTIDASGNDPTPDVNNGDGSRVLYINDGVTASNKLVSISGLTLTGGDVNGSGGAISSREVLSVIDSIISGNAARSHGGGIRSAGSGLTVIGSSIDSNSAGGVGGGIFCTNSYGTTTVTASTIVGNTAVSFGGGIYCAGITTISSSMFIGNSAETGGGIYAAGNSRELTVIRSTVSGNSAVTDGGGILNDSLARITGSTLSGNTAGRDGGGIFNRAGGLEVIHSTITENSADEGGGIHSFGNSFLTGTTSTIVDNEFGGDTVLNHILIHPFLSHSIVARNIRSASAAPDDATGLMRMAFSLLGTNTGTSVDNKGGNLIGTADAPIDPLLGPLADNGGPTLTHALLPGSPAINRGDWTAVAGVGGVPEFDQRGAPFGRVFHGRIDIGAFEHQAASDLNLVVDTLVDESDGNYALGDLSLREALLLANTFSSVDTIQFAPALTAAGPAVITLTMGELAVTDSASIVGPGAELLTIDASGNDPTPDVNNGDGIRVFNIDDGNNAIVLDVSTSGLTLTGGDVTSVGGAVRALENLTLRDSVISGNAAAQSGGGVYVGGGAAADVTGGSFRENWTGVYGGGFAANVENSLVTISGSEFAMNFAGDDGGGVYVRSNGGTVELANLDVRQNETSGSGTFGPAGGGIFGWLFNAAEITIRNSTVRDNVQNGTESTGAGMEIVALDASVVTIEGNVIEGNTANGSGAAGGGISIIARSQSSVSIVGNQIRENLVEGPQSGGGGIYASITTGASLMLVDNVVANNRALGTNSLGGGVRTEAVVTLVTISGGSITGNTAGFGGGVRSSGRLTINGATISGNSVTTDGGGINSSGTGNVNINGSTIIGNTAGGHGGGVRATGSSWTITNSTISENSAGLDGGGISSLVPIITMTGTTLNRNSAGQHGGAIWQRGNTLNITGSSIINNMATGEGGGIYHRANGATSVTDSTLGGNSAGTDGGGILANGSTLRLLRTTVQGNSAGRNGGGVMNLLGTFVGPHHLFVTDSTISGNSAADSGGGVHAESFDSLSELTVHGSTISGNTATDNGGGLHISGFAPTEAVMRHSTVALNSAALGGGVFVGSGELALDHAMVALNTATLGTDVSGLLGAVISPRFSLIGNNSHSGLSASPPGMPDSNGNLIGDATTPIDPLLGPLANNGGPAMTHALLAGSPVIDAGDPAVVFNPAEFDQRGSPFVRVFDGDGVGDARIDIGAFELQPQPAAFFGDYNLDGATDAADYVFWRKMVGTSVAPPFSGADGDGDSSIDPGDYDVWEENFGEVLPGSGRSGEWRVESGEPTARAVEGQGVAALAESEVHAGQPPALPGVLWWESMSARRTTGEPPAEPGAGGRLVASYGKRDEALAAWLGSRVIERGDEAFEVYLDKREEVSDQSEAESFDAFDAALEGLTVGV